MGSRKKYTIHDIARELNTTSSTVSRALQDNPRISQKMRQAVQEMAVRMDYQPDFRATSLRTGKGRTIGVMVPQVDRHFFASVLRGIDEVATSSKYNVLICQSYESFEKESALVRSLLSGKIDGLIASVSIETQDKDAGHFEMLQKKGIPLVFFDRILPGLRVSKVVIDDYRGAVMSVEHLIRNGCSRIAHFAGPQHIHVYANRSRGYKDTLIKHGLFPEEQLIFPHVITRETGYMAMDKILGMDPLPDAIFSSGDYSALGAIIRGREAGLSIPEDMAISGFANEPFGAIIEPSLTSVDQHAIEMGKQTASLLIEEIEDTGSKFVPRTIVLDPHLIVRKSSLQNGNKQAVMTKAFTHKQTQ